MNFYFLTQFYISPPFRSLLLQIWPCQTWGLANRKQELLRINEKRQELFTEFVALHNINEHDKTFAVYFKTEMSKISEQDIL